MEGLTIGSKLFLYSSDIEVDCEVKILEKGLIFEVVDDLNKVGISEVVGGLNVEEIEVFGGLNGSEIELFVDLNAVKNGVDKLLEVSLFSGLEVSGFEIGIVSFVLINSFDD